MPSEKPVRPLHTLAYGETAVITSMYLHGAIRQRLQDLGWICLLYTSPSPRDTR